VNAAHMRDMADDHATCSPESTDLECVFCGRASCWAGEDCCPDAVSGTPELGIPRASACATRS
jgi:hypothetical protein